MKKLKLQKTLGALVILTYLATQTIVFGGIVLCKGADGHFDFEFTYGDKCADSPGIGSKNHPHPFDAGPPISHEWDSSPTLLSSTNKANSPSENSGVDACCGAVDFDHCGDCEDIPVPFLAGKEVTQEFAIFLKPLTQGAPPPFAIFSNQQKQSTPALLPSTPFPKFPRFLSTTILLL